MFVSLVLVFPASHINIRELMGWPVGRHVLDLARKSYTDRAEVCAISYPVPNVKEGLKVSPQPLHSLHTRREHDALGGKCSRLLVRLSGTGVLRQFYGHPGGASSATMRQNARAASSNDTPSLTTIRWSRVMRKNSRLPGAMTISVLGCASKKEGSATVASLRRAVVAPF